MSQLTIRLLGSPEISVDQIPLSFRTRKVEALFIYLVVNGGMQRRESLMKLFWPESNAKNATVTLRGTLSRLRQSLQPAGDLLIFESGKVGFDSSCSYILDIDWLQQAVLPEQSGDVLTSIRDIDRGEFLTGFSLPDAPDFDYWVSVKRETYQRQVESVYERLSQFQLATHKIGDAMDTAAQWVAHAPLSESAYRRLMETQFIAGDRPAAIKTFQECRKVLEKEFQIAPSKKTILLADQIKKDLEKRPGGQTKTRQDEAAARVPSEILPVRDNLLLPFEGRHEELKKLVSAFRQAVEGGAQILTMIGPAGVGKIRLIQTFLDWAAMEQPTVEIWQGRAFEMGGCLPYQPVIEALRMRLEEENAPEDLLDDVWLAELSQLIPELRARYPDLPLPMQGDSNFMRSRLFSALDALGIALAAKQPAIFVLEDMQWSDADSRDLVHYLGERWAKTGAHILILVTLAQESLSAEGALRDWLVRMGRDARLERLTLEALQADEVRAMITRLTGPLADPATINNFSHWLLTETGGLPFFMDAVLGMLSSRGILQMEGFDRQRGYDFKSAVEWTRSAAPLPVPSGVQEAIAARLKRLPERENTLLLAAAVLGRECKFETLRQVAGIDEDEAIEAVEALLKARLLTETRGARQPYMLAHDFIRKVVYNQNNEARRRVFHRRALIALENGRAPAAECAFHAIASLLDEPAFRFSLQAGDEALRSNAFQDALAHYNRAREAAVQLNTVSQAADSDLMIHLYEKRGRVLELIYQYEQATENYLEMADLAKTRSDPEMKLAALIAECVIHATHTAAFNPPKARELGQAALELAVTSGKQPGEARALWCLMMAEFHSGGDNQLVLTYGEKALTIARKSGLKELEGFVLSSLSWTYLIQLQLQEAQKANEAAQEIWQALGNYPMLADTSTIRMAILRYSGDYEKLLTTGQAGLQLCQSIGNQMHENMAWMMTGEIHCIQGELDQANENLQTAAAIAEDYHNNLDLQGIHSYMILLHICAGAYDQAQEWADRLYAVRSEFMPVFRSHFYAAVVWAKLLAGKPEESRNVMEEAAELCDLQGPFSFGQVLLTLANGYLHLALSHPQLSYEQVDGVIGQLNRIGSRYYLADLYYLQGMAGRALKKDDQAEIAFREAKTVAEKGNERIILWQILVRLSELESDQGQAAEAENYLGQARQIAAGIAERTSRQELKSPFLELTEAAGMPARA